MNIKLKNLIKTVVLNLFLIAAIVYFVVQYSKEQKVVIETERTEIITKQDIIETNGYIFRNELPILSPNKDNIVYTAEDGDKVNKDGTVAVSNQTANDLYLQDKLESLDKKISILEKSNINLDFVTVNLEKINSDSEEIYVNFLYDTKNNDLKDSSAEKINLLVFLNKKQLMTKNIDSFDSIIKGLESERSNLKANDITGNSGAFKINSSKSGIFYSKPDGYENIFVTEEIKNLTFDRFDELISSSPDNELLSNAIGKVAYEYEWYLVCNTEKNRETEFIEGYQYDVIYSYSSNKTIKMILYKKTEKINTNQILLIFKTTTIPPDFDFTRRQPVRVVFSEIKGLKVPEQAIRIFNNEDGSRKVGIYILKGDVIKFKELPDNECIGKYEGYYIYTEPQKRSPGSTGSLQTNEEIVMQGKNLYDGKVISR